MADNFDTLSIRITASATNAIKKVNALADALGKLNGALNGIDTSGLEQVTSGLTGLNGQITVLRGNTRTIRTAARNLNEMGQTAGGVAEATDSMRNLADGIREASQNAGNESAGNFRRFADTLRGFASGVANTGVKNVAAFGKAFLAIGRGASNVIGKIRDFAKQTKKTSSNASSLAKELLRVSKMMKLMITRMILRKIITGIGDGFKNLAQYSSQVNASMSLLWNSFRQLGNSIAAAVSPLLNALAPALNYLIQLIISAVNAINQLISAMLGLGVWTRAKTLTDDYAKSLEKAGGAAKELKKTVLGFDELNQLQDNKNSGGGATSPANMFEEAAVDKKWKDLADKILDPIKRAWARVGDYVKKSWEKAFKNVKKLGKDIADDFLEVWNQPRTVQMLEDMFRIVGNIGQFVGNLASSFDRAWNKADVGKRILENIRNICAEIVAGVEDITLSWALWADKVNFSPFLESIEKWTASLEKPVSTIMDMLSDFNDHFIQPVATWLIEDGIPKLIDIFTDFNNKVEWDVIKERVDRVWQALAPFAIEVGEGLVQFMGKVGDKVAKFLNSDAWDAFIDTLIKWTAEVDADDVEHGLTIIADALIAYESMKWLSTIATGLKTFFGAFGGASAAGTGAEAAAGGISAFAGALQVLGAVWAGLAIAETQKDSWFEKWGERLGIEKEQTDRMSEYYKGISGDWQLLKDDFNLVKGAITGDVVEIRNAEGELVSSNAGWVQKLHDQAATEKLQTSVIKANIQGRIDARKTETSEFSSAAESQKSILERLKQTTKDSTSSMRADFSTAKTQIGKDMADTQKSVEDSTKKIRSSFDKDKWTFSGVGDGLEATFKSAKDKIKSVWNSIADSLNGSHSIGGASFPINLPKLYATDRKSVV